MDDTSCCIGLSFSYLSGFVVARLKSTTRCAAGTHGSCAIATNGSCATATDGPCQQLQMVLAQQLRIVLAQ